MRLGDAPLYALAREKCAIVAQARLAANLLSEKRANNLPHLALAKAIDIDHAQKIVKCINEAQIPITAKDGSTRPMHADYIHSDMSPQVRDAKMKNFEIHHSTDIMVQVDTATDDGTVRLGDAPLYALAREKCAIVAQARLAANLLSEKRADNLPHLALAKAIDIHHAKQIVTCINEAQIPIKAKDGSTRPMHADCIHSNMPRQVRDTKMKNFEIHHSTDIMVQVDTLGEGYDNVLISVALIFTPKMNLPSFAQYIGRAVRKITSDKVGQRLMPSPKDNVTHVIALTAFEYVSNWVEFAAQNRTEESYEDEALDENIEAAQDHEDDNATLLHAPFGDDASQRNEEEAEDKDVPESDDVKPTKISLHRSVLARTHEMESKIFNEERARCYSEEYTVHDHLRLIEANEP